MILKTKDICKFYGQNKVLDNVSIALKKGTIHGLLGENGAGKSTLISILTGLISANSGTVYYMDNDIYDNLKNYKQSIGLVPQELSLFDDLKVIDNLQFWASCYKLDKKAANLKIAEVSSRLALNDVLNKKVLKLSGGYKRRLNLACTLLHSPKILVLDEPTVAIDVMARNIILDIVKELASEGVSVIYTSHYIDEIEKISDYVSILHKGKIIEQFTKEQLVVMAETYSKVEIIFDKSSADKIETLKNIATVSDIAVVDNKVILTTNNDFRINDILALGISNNIKDLTVMKNSLESKFINLIA